ncbi:MAG: chorismate--pyruvate lyase, partial [Acinetobacter pseudolwoffii]|nr:chorismate--pyruvate lyase [Acinetobacter pseudolwoffii]
MTYFSKNQHALMPTMSAELKPWLYASGSLTQQLTGLAQGQFHVEPIQE